MAIYTDLHPENASRVNAAKEFLDLVYGTESVDNGYVTIWNGNADYNTQHPNGVTLAENSIHCKVCGLQVGKNEEIAECVIEHSNLLHCYTKFNLINTTAGLHDFQLGCMRDITYSPGVLLDIDFGDHGTDVVYPPTKEDALTVANSLELKPSIIIDSGGGLYGIWLFDGLVALDSNNIGQYQDIVKNLKANIAQAASEHGWAIDCTDITKSYRLPGTYNYKYFPKHEVNIAQEFNEQRYSFCDFDRLPKIQTRNEPRRIPTGAAIGDYERPAPANIKEITAKCPFMKYCWDHKENLDYTSWYACLSIAARCDDTGEIAREFSTGHPGFNEYELRDRIEQTKQAGPWRCETIYMRTEAGTACNSCKYYGAFNTAFVGQQRVFLLSTPLQAGDSSNQGIEADVVNEINKEYAEISIGGKFVILKEGLEESIVEDKLCYRPKIDLMGKDDFKNFLLPYTSLVWKERGDNPKQVKKENSLIWLESKMHRKYEGMTMARDKELRLNYNVWKGFNYEPKEGDWSLFKNHIYNVLANGDRKSGDYLIKWLAWVVQNGGKRKSEVSVVFRGKQRTGKGTFVRFLGNLFNTSHYFQTQEKEQIVGKFNGHLLPVIVLFADEASWAGDIDAQNKMKGLITEERMSYEFKFQKPFQERSYLNVVVATNESWAIRAEDDSKRYFVLDINNSMAGNKSYFGALNDQMNNGGYEAMLHDLLLMDLCDFDVKNFPKTNALFEQKLKSNPIARFVFGYLKNNRVNWQTTIDKDFFYDRFLDGFGDDPQARGIKPKNKFFGEDAVQRYFPVSTKWTYRQHGISTRQIQLPEWRVCVDHFKKVMEVDELDLNEDSFHLYELPRREDVDEIDYDPDAYKVAVA